MIIYIRTLFETTSIYTALTSNTNRSVDMFITIEINPSRSQTCKDETERSSMLDQNLYFQIAFLRHDYNYMIIV
jgi:hypothetical protein